MKKWRTGILSMVLVVGSMAMHVVAGEASVRIKEIAQFDGARENQLMGYGIVVGLNGTGDKGKSVFTVRSIAGMLQRLGLKVNGQDIAVKNAAAVMVTATLPPFVKNGARIDVTLSSLGDAKSLAGGMLLQTPLQGPDGVVYAVAQGSISVGGMTNGQASGYTTVAHIPDGALVEREVPVTLVKDGYLRLILEHNDFTTSARVAEAINMDFGSVIAYPVDGGAVAIKLPGLFKDDVVKFVSKIERIEVVPDYQSKIIINERTGTIVGGRDVKISAVHLTHMNINLDIQGTKKTTSTTTDENGVASLHSYSNALFHEGASEERTDTSNEISVGELASYLNSLGLGAKDIIAILNGIKAAGAIQAEITIV